jgi:hypothetical protein
MHVCVRAHTHACVCKHTFTQSHPQTQDIQHTNTHTHILSEDEAPSTVDEQSSEARHGHLKADANS